MSIDNERIYFGKNEIFICEGSEIKARHPLQDLIYPKASGFAIFYKQLVQNHPRTIMDCWNEWMR